MKIYSRQMISQPFLCLLRSLDIESPTASRGGQPCRARSWPRCLPQKVRGRLYPEHRQLPGQASESRGLPEDNLSHRNPSMDSPNPTVAPSPAQAHICLSQYNLVSLFPPLPTPPCCSSSQCPPLAGRGEASEGL